MLKISSSLCNSFDTASGSLIKLGESDLYKVGVRDATLYFVVTNSVLTPSYKPPL